MRYIASSLVASTGFICYTLLIIVDLTAGAITMIVCSLILAGILISLERNEVR